MSDIKNIIEISEKVQKDITAFTDDHKGMVVFIADPESDTIFMAHGDKLIARRIVSPVTGKVDFVVKQALHYKKGEEARGQLLLMLSTMFWAIARDKSDTGILSRILKGRRDKPSKK